MQLLNPPIETGDRVKVSHLRMFAIDEMPYFVPDRFIEARSCPGTIGKVGSWLPRTNEQLWFVHHDFPIGSIAVYWADELEAFAGESPRSLAEEATFCVDSSQGRLDYLVEEPD